MEEEEEEEEDLNCVNFNCYIPLIISGYDSNKVLSYLSLNNTLFRSKLLLSQRN